MVSNEIVDRNTCPHGEPFPGCSSDLHSEGLDTLVHLVHKYSKKGRTDAGYKAARKFAQDSPDLVDTFTVAYVASAGTRTLLYDAVGERPFAFYLAQVISSLEKRLYGSASAADVERDNLVHFFKCRIPCGCLDELAEEEPPEETGICAAVDCGACKPVAELMACAACKTAFYCDSNCQREHWPLHASMCCVLTDKSKGDETSVTDMETSGQFSVYSIASSARSKHSERTGRSGRSDRTGRSGKSAKSGRSGKSGKSSRRKRKNDLTFSSPTTPRKRKDDLTLSSPTTPRKRKDDLILSPTRSLKKTITAPNSPKRSSHRRSLTSLTNSPTKSVKSVVSSSSSRRKSSRKSDKGKSKEKKPSSENFDSSSGSLSLARKEKRKSHKSASHREEHKERRKSKSSGSTSRRHRHKESSEKRESKSKKTHEETAQ